MKTNFEMANACQILDGLSVVPSQVERLIELVRADERERLPVEVEALKADAKRYRAIRGGLEVDPDNSGIVVSLIDDFGNETLSGEAADAAIDAAIRARGNT